MSLCADNFNVCAQSGHGHTHSATVRPISAKSPQANDVTKNGHANGGFNHNDHHHNDFQQKADILPDVSENDPQTDTGIATDVHIKDFQQKADILSTVSTSEPQSEVGLADDVKGIFITIRSPSLWAYTAHRK